MNFFYLSARHKLLLCMVVSLVANLSMPVNAKQQITLGKAIELTLQKNPELTKYPLIIRGSEALAIQAERQPQMRLNVTAENMIGTGEFSGTDNSELSLSISQVFETKEKSSKRFKLADAKTKKLHAEYRLVRKSLIAETARRYYQVLYLQNLLNLNTSLITQNESFLETVKSLSDAGAVGKGNVSRMKLRLEEARFKEKMLKLDLEIASTELSSLWQKNVKNLLPRETFNAPLNLMTGFKVDEHLEAIPQLQYQEVLRLIAEKHLALEEAKGSSDFEFSLGVKRHQRTSDQSLRLGFSMPLSFENPNRGNISAAKAELALSQEQTLTLALTLRLELERLNHSLIRELELLEQQETKLLPLSRTLVNQIESGYKQGQYSLLEWIDAVDKYFEIKLSVLERKLQVFLIVLKVEELSGKAISSTNSNDLSNNLINTKSNHHATKDNNNEGQNRLSLPNHSLTSHSSKFFVAGKEL